MSIASTTSAVRYTATSLDGDEPLRPELHPKLPSAPTAAPLLTAQAYVAEPVAEPPLAELLPAAPGEPLLVAEALESANPTATPADDDPLARRERAAGATLFPGLGAWLWHVRLSLTAGGASAVVHAVAVVVMGAIVWRQELRPDPPPALEVSVPIERYIEKVEPPIVAVLQAEKPSIQSDGRNGGSGTGSAGANGGRGNGALGGIQMAALLPSAPTLTSAGGTGLGTDRAYGNDMLGELGERKTGATFFGVRAEGRSFVFVVDTSGSMATNNRYLRCRAELLRAVSELGAGQKYFIAFFNHQTFAMPERKLVEARSPQIKKTMQWIVNALPMGSTEPWDGVYMALRMKPDAIFLLTDGEFSPDVMRKIIDAQPGEKKIPIHTIAFESMAGEQTLQTISRVTGGKYLYVP